MSMRQDFGTCSPTAEREVQMDVWLIFRQALEVNIDDQYDDGDTCLAALVSAVAMLEKVNAFNCIGTINFYMRSNLCHVVFPVLGNEMLKTRNANNRLNTQAKESSHNLENHMIKQKSLREVVLYKKGWDEAQQKIVRYAIENPADHAHLNENRSFDGFNNRYEQRILSRKNKRTLAVTQQRSPSIPHKEDTKQNRRNVQPVSGFPRANEKKCINEKKKRSALALGFGKPPVKRFKSSNHVPGGGVVGVGVALEAFSEAKGVKCKPENVDESKTENSLVKKCQSCKDMHYSVDKCRTQLKHIAPSWNIGSPSPVKVAVSPRARNPRLKRTRSKSPSNAPSKRTQIMSPRKGKEMSSAKVDLRNAFRVKEQMEVLFSPEDGGWCNGYVTIVEKHRIVLEFADKSTTTLTARSGSSIRVGQVQCDFDKLVSGRIEASTESDYYDSQETLTQPSDVHDSEWTDDDDNH